MSKMVYFNLVYSFSSNNSRYTDTLLEQDVDGKIYTNSSSRKTGPQPDRGRRQLIIATGICAVFFVAGKVYWF